MKSFTWKEGALIAVCLVVFAAFVAYLWNERSITAKGEQVMLGKVRANGDTRIFHVPTCPQYDSIKPENLREFATVADAEAANFRASMNCLEAVQFRRNAEHGEFDTADNPPEDPRQ